MVRGAGYVANSTNAVKKPGKEYENLNFTSGEVLPGKSESEIELQKRDESFSSQRLYFIKPCVFLRIFMSYIFFGRNYFAILSVTRH